MYPEWLPPQLVLNGSLQDDYSKLYAIFQQDLLVGGLEIEGFPVKIDTNRDRLMPTYESGFTHLVTRGDGTGTRTIDYERARKLSWVKPVVQNYAEPEVTSFWCDDPRGEEVLYLWLSDFDFIVILKWMRAASERSKIIVTSYHVEGRNKRYYQRLFGRATRIL